MPEGAKGGELLPLEVRGLTFHAGGRVRLDAVNLDITTPGVTVIMGPNGAGKSLLIRLLHGLLEPHGGTIRWNGENLNAHIRLRQAMVFQKPVLLRRSVKANIDFVLSLRRDKPKSAAEYLKDAGLTAQAGQPARTLSGGEQQRLALARALASDPSILFLDEPTASLDPTSTLLIETMVSGASREGLKVILVTHDITQARRLADDVVFLFGGAVLEHTDATAFFHKPKTMEAAAYLSGQLLVKERQEFI